jgi:hypothetical protein
MRPAGEAVLSRLAALARALRVATRGTTLYRAVSPAEYAELSATGKLRSIPESLEFVKWFAETPEDARRWGEQEMFYGQATFHVIKATWARTDPPAFRRRPRLDGIGPAWSVQCEAWPDARVDVTLRWWDVR